MGKLCPGCNIPLSHRRRACDRGRMADGACLPLPMHRASVARGRAAARSRRMLGFVLGSPFGCAIAPASFSTGSLLGSGKRRRLRAERKVPTSFRMKPVDDHGLLRLGLALPVAWLDTYGRRRHVDPCAPRIFPCRFPPQAGTPTSIPRACACSAKIRGSGRGAALRLPSARLWRLRLCFVFPAMNGSPSQRGTAPQDGER